MEYQFSRHAQHQPVATFSMGSEAFAHWFTEELGGAQEKIASLLDIIEQLNRQQMSEYCLKGSELDLLLTPDEVEVKAHLLDSPIIEELPEGTELYDHESMAGCGLADFKQVLLSWQEFVSN